MHWGWLVTIPPAALFGIATCGENRLFAVPAHRSPVEE